MNWRERLHTLRRGEKEKFFDHYPLETIREVFIENPRDYGGVEECCNTHVNWGHWDDVCEDLGFTELTNLPENVHCSGIGNEYVELWLEVVYLLTSYPKITKTFKELL